MPRRKFDDLGWNLQYKWKPVRPDRWDPFPKDHLPFIDDYADQVEFMKGIQSEGKRPRPGDDSARKAPGPGKRPAGPSGAETRAMKRARIQHDHDMRRAYNAAKKLAYAKTHPGGPLGTAKSHRFHWTKGDTAMAVGAAGILAAPLVGAALVEGEVVAAGAAAVRAASQRLAARAVTVGRARLLARFEQLKLAGRFKEALELYKDYRYLGRGGVGFGRKLVRLARRTGLRAGYNLSRGIQIEMSRF